MINLFPKITVVLIFILAGVLFFHNFTSINVDIGRHIKLGEIIWQTKNIPHTNLFSFTAPDFLFINHHWLSEVIFYGIFNIGWNWSSGLQAIITFKIAILFVAYFILYLSVKRQNTFAVILSFVCSIFVFSARTEARPEIFSYLIFSLYLFLIYKLKEGPNLKIIYLWLLPILQLFWVNLHIYFVIGPIIFLFFLVDRGISFNGLKFWNWNLFRVLSLEFRIFAILILANLANPNFIEGALYPFKVLGSYGYSVAENSSLFFLAEYFGRWSVQDKLFLVSLFVLSASFMLVFWRNKTAIKNRAFDLLLITFTAALSFKMQRNIPLFALALWPVLSENLDAIFRFAMSRFNRHYRTLLATCYILLTTFLIGSIYFVTSNNLYDWLNSPKIFGLGVSSAAQDGTDFIKGNKIQGPMFNNFDIGSYLVWQLYPDQKVFVDGRPEAYPVDFFSDVYKPIQRDENLWEEISSKYDLNYIFFTHTDMTEWAEEFLARIRKDEKWPMVFLNDAVTIFLRDNNANRKIIDKYKITDENIWTRIQPILAKLNKKDDNAFINFGNVLFQSHWLGASAKVYEDLITYQPDNPYGYQGAAYAYATMNDLNTQEKAAQNFERAIMLGFKTFNNYLTLGIINANLGNWFEAEENIKKAIKINPNNQNARQALEVIKRKTEL